MVIAGDDDGTNSGGQDDVEYYVDQEGEDVSGGDEINDRDRDGATGVVQNVVFVIEDNVDPGIYRGRIVNVDKGDSSTIVKGIINVAAVTVDSADENDNISNYILDDVENDTGTTITT